MLDKKEIEGQVSKPNICSECGESIKSAAKICPHCMRGLTRWSRLERWIPLCASIATTGALIGLVWSNCLNMSAIKLIREQTDLMHMELKYLKEEVENPIGLDKIRVYAKDDITHIDVVIKNEGAFDATDIEITWDVIDLSAGIGYQVRDSADIIQRGKTLVLPQWKKGILDSLAIKLLVGWTWKGIGEVDSSIFHRRAQFIGLTKDYELRVLRKKDISLYWPQD